MVSKELLSILQFDAEDITEILAKDNVYGCQFHPEKSGNVGLAILRAFCEEESVC